MLSPARQQEFDMQFNPMMIFYVNETAKSADFYAKILDMSPIDNAPGFAMFKLNDGVMLGLWKRSDVKPSAHAIGGASELGLHVGDNTEVDRLHQKWKSSGVAIAQEPVQLDFGYTFTAEDADGHRIRVFATP
jgi:predicted enzyme related to lactoylglutathione lyase